MREVYRVRSVPEEALRNMDKLPDNIYGKAEIFPNTVEADSVQSFLITYTVAECSIDTGMGISIHIPDKGWSAPSLDYKKDGYVEARTNADAKLEIYLPEGPNTTHWFCIKVVEGKISKGEKIDIYYGGEGENAPGAEVANYPGDFCFMVSFNLNPFPEYAKSLWSSEHPGYCIYSKRLKIEPLLSVTGNKAERLNLVLPSTAVCGTNANLIVQLMDRCHNPASSTEYSCIALSWDNGQKVDDISFDKQSSFRLEMPLKLPKEEGVYYLLGEWGGRTWISNPIQLKNKVDEFIYWGDLHAQGAQSDGYGEPEEYFRRARYDSCLDIACLTDHSDGICFPIMLDSNEWREDKWDHLNQVTCDTYEPGKFVNFSAMELSSDVKKYPSGIHERNHRNAYFFDEKKSICFNWREFPDATDWYRFLRETRYMIIPHTHVAKLDCCYHNPFAERVIEIMSDKGSGEFFHVPELSATENHGGVLEFLKCGYRVGFVGSGDYHHNTPGRHFPVKEKTGFYGCMPDMAGLAAVRASKLDRASVWSAIYNRKTYATTGVRILLDIKMRYNDSIIGMAEEKVVSVTDSSNREFIIQYALTAPLKRIELIRNGELDNPVAIYDKINAENSFIKSDYTNEIILTDETELLPYWLDANFPPMPPHKFIFYYVRIIQEDGEIAWSSPIWLSDRPIMPLLENAEKA